MPHFNDPTSIIARLRRAGVRVIDDPDHPSAYVATTPEGFTLGLGRLYHSVTPDLQTTILQHELGHIVRAGDRPPADIADKPQYWQAWNIACDAVINSSLDPAKIHALKGITYQYIRKHIPSLPQNVPDTLTIFNALKAQTDELLALLASRLFDAHDNQQQPHSDPKLKETIIKVFLDPDLAAIAKGVGNITIHRDPLTEISPRHEPQLAKLLREIHTTLRALSARLIRTRTWTRPGRLPCLRGITRIPQGRILIGVDVSGSMAAPATDAAAVATALAHSHHCDIVSWDTTVTPGITTTGGGTTIQPLWRYAEQHRYDVIVVLTDCAIPDIRPLPHMPILWAVYGNSKPDELRPHDRLFIMEHKL